MAKKTPTDPLDFPFGFNVPQKKPRRPRGKLSPAARAAYLAYYGGKGGRKK